MLISKLQVKQKTRVPKVPEGISLANSIFSVQIEPENKNLVRFIPLKFYRRQLHVFQPAKDGKRKEYGATVSLGIPRGKDIRNMDMHMWEVLPKEESLYMI